MKCVCVDHSWCMGIVGHSLGGLGGAAMEVVVGRRWSTSRVRGGDTDDIRSHRPPGGQIWIGLSRNWPV